MPLKKKKAGSKKKIVKKRTLRKKRATKAKVKRVRKPVKKTRKTPVKKIEGKVVGKVTHYFPHVMAAVIKVSSPINTGDTLKIKGHTTDFTQTVTSMQVDHVPVKVAKKGEEIGLLVNSRVRQHDTVYRV